MTKFEQDLQAYFPDIYSIHEYSQVESHIWEIFKKIKEMKDTDSYGEVRIMFQAGKVNSIYVNTQVRLSEETKRHNRPA